MSENSGKNHSSFWVRCPGTFLKTSCFCSPPLRSCRWLLEHSLPFWHKPHSFLFHPSSQALLFHPTQREEACWKGKVGGTGKTPKFAHGAAYLVVMMDQMLLPVARPFEEGNLCRKRVGALGQVAQPEFNWWFQQCTAHLEGCSQARNFLGWPCGMG